MKLRIVIVLLAALLAACAPVKKTSEPAAAQTTDAVLAEKDGMVLLRGGEFLMGSNEMPYESPVHAVTVDDFWIDKTEVTVAQFAEFVKATGYRTEAERYGWSGAFNLQTGEWEKTDGATWRFPEGKNAPESAPDEPVTQVSWNDARAFADWAKKRLPTEAEWEYAARGGLKQNKFVWGNQLRPEGKPVANWWQGRFPDQNTAEDGFAKRAPVGRFAPNNFGLYDMAGNVWEWTADWFDESYYARSPKENPKGAPKGNERAMRGGSWMCAENFCTNYRPAARSHATPDSGMNNVGFRLVKDVVR